MPYAAVSALVDRHVALGAGLLGAVPVVLAALVVWVKWWRSRDEVFVGVTPGLVPDDPASAPRERVRGGEWKGTVAAQFQPPRGVSPGLAGTVIDGEAHAHDVSACLLDLAVRGFFTITEISPDGDGRAEGTGERTTGRRDWELRRAETAPAEPLSGFERILLDNLFTAGPVVRLASLKGHFAMTMRQAQIGLYQEVVDRGWYRRHPRAKNARARFWGLVLLVPLTLLILAGIGYDAVANQSYSLAPLAAGALLAVLILIRWGRSRTPRTAEGTAVRIEALGFKNYLETAEADQIRFEEAASIFSRYLPYAMAFGIAAVWAKLFGEVAKAAQLAGWTDPFWDLAWFDVADLALHSASLAGDIGSLALDLPDVTDALGGITDGIGDAVEGVTGMMGGVGDFTEAAGGLFSFDGLDGCDGCDLGGCDF